jgi:hypothetical protein
VPQAIPANVTSTPAQNPTPVPLSTKTLIPTSTLAPTIRTTATALPADTATVTTTSDSCPNGDCITACFNKLPPITSPGDKSQKHTSHTISNEDGYPLVTYTISGDQITDPVESSGFPAWLKPYQKDRASQQKIWNYFAAIIPAEQRSVLSEFVIFSDGKDNDLASVAQSTKDMNKWELDVDILDASNPQDLTDTLIHESGHLLSLNPSQVIPSKPVFDNPDSDTIYQKEVDACPTYFPGEGCSKPDSYINKFYQRFWPRIEKEWSKIDAIDNEDDYDAALEAFYEKYQDQFVSDYAPTDPTEDFAESFADFILKPKPEGNSIANQKVLFFYDFPEFVTLRTQIGSRLCAQLSR